MEPILTYLAPPMVGAFIGYMTNYVAIRMLFRPLKPWRVLGIRVPMTPGVIPSKRHQLAENIGSMVGGHLFTSEDVRRALTEKGFLSELDQLLGLRLEGILDRDLGPVATLIPARFRSYFEAGVKVLRWRTLNHIHAHIDSKAFADHLARTIEERLEDFLSQDFSETLSDEVLTQAYGFIEKTTVSFLGSPEVEEWISHYINRRIDDLLAEKKSIADLIPERLTLPLLEKIESQTPKILHKIAQLLQEPVMQDKIANTLCRGISSFTSSLGPMASLLGGFLDPDSIQEKIRDYLGRKGEEISNWLFDAAVQEKVAKILREKAEEFINTPIVDHLEDVDPEKVRQVRIWLSEQIVHIINSPKTTEAITSLLKESLEEQSLRPIGDILKAVIGPEGLAKGRDWIVGEVVYAVRSQRVKRLLDQVVTELVEDKLLNNPIGKLSSFLPLEIQNSAREYMVQQVSDLLVREVPPLIDTLNIKEIVAKKVDSLDLLRLEGLLMSIMQEQFKYINLFGALLGFLIGLLNLIFLLS